MSTAVTTAGTAGGDDARKSLPQGTEAQSIFHVYKPGEGYATRLGMMGVIGAYLAFAGWHWYFNWVFVRDFVDDMFNGIGLGKATRWLLDPNVSSVVAYGGTAVIVALGGLISFYYIYMKKATSEYLIRTDTELHKVTWPKISPWFKSETVVWGSTYVVLIVCVALTLYVFGIDMVLQKVSQLLFYGASH